MSALPKSTTPDATSKPPAPCLIHSRAPEGCVSETTSTVATAAGPVTIRVRRILAQYYIGGRGYQMLPRVEVAVRTPRTTTEGLGFVVIHGDYFDEAWRQPADDLAVHIALGATLEETAERRTSERRADDRPAARTSRRLARTPGEALHRFLGAAGIPSAEHYAQASRALGRTVTSLGALSNDDCARVRASVQPNGVPA